MIIVHKKHYFDANRLAVITLLTVLLMILVIRRRQERERERENGTTSEMFCGA